MTDEYNANTAYHYCAYRPPLHNLILEKLLKKGKRYTIGLDIGSGTGHSTLALVKFCNTAIGVEPSAAMRQKAIKNPKVSYVDYVGHRLKFEDDIFDIITLAGSLYYAKSQVLLNELIRVGKIEAPIIVYDFDLKLTDILDQLGFTGSCEDKYDHEADFSGLNEDSISMVSKGMEETLSTISCSNLAHIILSLKEVRDFLKKKYEKKSLNREIAMQLENLNGNGLFNIPVNLYFSEYSVTK